MSQRDPRYVFIYETVLKYTATSIPYEEVLSNDNVTKFLDDPGALLLACGINSKGKVLFTNYDIIRLTKVRFCSLIIISYGWQK